MHQTVSILVEYSDDNGLATVGVGRKFNDQWAGNVFCEVGTLVQVILYQRLASN